MQQLVSRFYQLLSSFAPSGLSCWTCSYKVWHTESWQKIWSCFQFSLIDSFTNSDSPDSQSKVNSLSANVCVHFHTQVTASFVNSLAVRCHTSDLFWSGVMLFVISSAHFSPGVNVAISLFLHPACSRASKLPLCSGGVIFCALVLTCMQVIPSGLLYALLFAWRKVWRRLRFWVSCPCTCISCCFWHLAVAQSPNREVVLRISSQHQDQQHVLAQKLAEFLDYSITYSLRKLPSSELKTAYVGPGQNTGKCSTFVWNDCI